MTAEMSQPQLGGRASVLEHGLRGPVIVRCGQGHPERGHGALIRGRPEMLQAQRCYAVTFKGNKIG